MNGFLSVFNPCFIRGSFHLQIRRSRTARPRPGSERGRILGPARGGIDVLDPPSEALGRVAEPSLCEPGGVLIERLVEVLRAAERDMPVLEREGLLRLLR